MRVFLVNMSHRFKGILAKRQAAIPVITFFTDLILQKNRQGNKTDRYATSRNIAALFKTQRNFSTNSAMCATINTEINTEGEKTVLE